MTCTRTAITVLLQGRGKADRHSGSSTKLLKYWLQKQWWVGFGGFGGRGFFGGVREVQET